MLLFVDCNSKCCNYLLQIARSVRWHGQRRREARLIKTGVYGSGPQRDHEILRDGAVRWQIFDAGRQTK